MPAVVGIAVVVLLIIMSATGAFSGSGASKAKAESPVKGSVQTAAGRRSTRKRKAPKRFEAKN